MATSQSGRRHLNLALIFATAVMAGILGSMPTSVVAQSSASPGMRARPIRMVIPFPPGNSGDIIARAIMPTATDVMKHTIIIDNRGGASGAIAAEIVASSTPDGTTLLFGTTGLLAINPAMYSKLPYHPVRDFAPVVYCAGSTYTIVVSPALPVSNLKEFVALAKAKPGELNLGSTGAGTGMYLSGVLFNSIAGVKITHVPYKGATDALTDLIAGRIQVMFATTSSAVPYVQSNKVRALAITGTDRDPALPQLPTVLETGVADYTSVSFFGVLAPRATPRAIIQGLNEAFVTALKAEVKQRLATLGVNVAWSTPEEFGDRIKRELEKWTKTVRAIGVQAD